MNFRRIRSFAKDKSGQFAVIAAVMSVPLLVAIGVAVDYSRMTPARAELQSAADAAALAAVSTNSQNQTGGISGSGWISGDAKKNMEDWFAANFGNTYDAVIGKAHVDVKRVGMQLISTVDVRASFPVTFMKCVGKTASPVRVNSTAVSNLPPFTDVYVLADNSPPWRSVQRLPISLKSSDLRAVNLRVAI